MGVGPYDPLQQGGIFPGNQGPRFPRNLRAHTKFLQQFTLFWREFDFKVYQYFLSNEGILPITHNMQEIFSCHRKKLLGTASNQLPQKEIYCHRKYLLSRPEISCHKKKFLVAGKNFLSEAEMSCHRKKFLGLRKNFLSQKETSCYRKEFVPN